jgi:hypothetical protein
MKSMYSFAVLFGAVIVLSCDSTSGKAADASAASGKSTEAKEAPSSASSQSDPIVGEWKLAMVAPDENGNEVIDANEKAKATTMEDYMKLNSDGSAEFYTIKLKGRYEIKTNASSGKRYLNLFDKDNTKHPRGAILSVTKDEMIILNKFGGDSFTVWKRI